MLVELSVENYAVVDRLRVRFHSGLNLLTGETGSGKSIIVDALGLLLGGRASSEMIRSGEARARVSGIFDVQNNSAVQTVLEPGGFDLEGGELLIEREILEGGKSRAFVGNRPVTVALLRELAAHLADIHGQHEQQLLFSPAAQRDMLDVWLDSSERLAKLRNIFREWRATETELEQLQGSEQEKLRLLDLWHFQRREIEAGAPAPNEDAGLEDERRVQMNLGRLQEGLSAAFAALYDAPESAYALVRLAARKLDELLRIDPKLGEIRALLEPAEIGLQEASNTLRDYLGRLEANPARLEQIESRLATLDRLKRKYGGTVEQVLAFLDDVKLHIASVENAGDRIKELQKQRDRLSADYEIQARELTAARKQAGLDLQKRVESELASLAMERTVFQIEVRPAGWSESGADAVEFLVSPNLGEEPRALEKVASGGEISRIALALKTCLALPRQEGNPRTLVFDEVDAGVGGSAAEGVGRRLKRLACSNQVLCVTHLPQIASFADHHYRVEKKERNGRTVAVIEELDQRSRTREIGRMISGHKLTPEALKHAEQLIRMSGG